MIKLMEKASIFIQMEPSIRASGKKISNMAMEKKPGQMVLVIKDNTKRAEKMDMGSSFGLTAQPTKEISLITIFTAQESTPGQIKGNIMANGKTIKCMAKEYLLGRMAECMMENILMIRSKVMEFLPGLMEGSMKVIG